MSKELTPREALLALYEEKVKCGSGWLNIRNYL
jgi:hypothetical protein